MQGPLPYRTRTIDGPADDLLTLAECSKYVRMSQKTLRRLIDEGKFPRPIVLPRGGKWWHWLDVVAFLHLQDRLRPTGQEFSEGQGVEPEGQGVEPEGQPRRGR